MKLTYFDGRGLAEVSRLMLAYTGTKYEDNRYKTKEEFDIDKQAGKFSGSMGKLPYLEVKTPEGNIVTISQSKSIERFIARRYGLTGSDEFEEARIDSICESVRDVTELCYKADSLYSDREKEEFYRSKFKEELDKLTKVITKNDPMGLSYAVGSSISRADIAIYHLAWTYSKYTSVEEIIQNNERISHIVRNVEKQPGISVWVERRPNTPF